MQIFSVHLWPDIYFLNNVSEEQKTLILKKSSKSVLPFIDIAFEEVFTLSQSHKEFSHMFSSQSFIILDFTMKIIAYLDLIFFLCYEAYFVHILIFNFSSAICWKGYNCSFASLLKTVDNMCGAIWILSSVLLFYMTRLSISHCLDYCTFRVSLEIWYCMPSLFFFKMFLDILVSLPFCVYFRTSDF